MSFCPDIKEYNFHQATRMAHLTLKYQTFRLKKIASSFYSSITHHIQLLSKRHKIRKIQIQQMQLEKNIRKKPRIKVAFFLIHDSVWKYERLYRLMEKNDRFDPIVIVCPYITFGEETMLREMNHAYHSFKKKKYNILKAYDESKNVWLDVKKEICPDIVFFTNPHKLTRKEYYITNFTDCLTCYAPYNFGNSHLYQMMYNQIFHNYIWLLFAETELHKEFSKKYATNEGINVVVTGFPGTDVFLDHNYQPQDPWKIKDPKIKRIIWAPHHTIDDNKSFLSFSSFLTYADFMIELVKKFENEIQIAFKPHPLLYDRLVANAWGDEKTKIYFNNWKELKNGQLVEDDYTDLFLTSDALMHDSGSFLIEYLYTGKPVLHLNRDKDISDRLNEFGKLAFDHHYHAKTESDIIDFINNILSQKDEKKAERLTFRTNFLLPPNGISASENILNELIKRLN